MAGKRGGSWIVAAESASEPAIVAHVNGGPHPFDRMSATPGLRVELWRAPDREWTLVGLSSDPNSPVILIIDGDWTPCALVFGDLAHSFSLGGREHASSARPLDAISQHLTRALADTSGLAAVGEVVLHHVVQAVPSGMASLAVAASDGELSIVATHGYPRALVEHLRIPAGSGVIGAVHVSRMPLLVPDVTATPGLDRHRSRYRTGSFAAVPIVAGASSLGVISLTDRLTPGPYTPDDLNALSVLLAPAALALGRERAWREAQVYAQAAVIDPVSGLFNRRGLSGALGRGASARHSPVDVGWLADGRSRWFQEHQRSIWPCRRGSRHPRHLRDPPSFRAHLRCMHALRWRGIRRDDAGWNRGERGHDR